MALRRAKPDPKARPPGRTVLVVGTDDWAVEQAVEQLTASGHRTLTCHPPGQPAFPCNALVEGRVCPLDEGFDVVLTARATPERLPTVGEMGVICALHAGKPLVTAGTQGRSPFVPWTTREVGGGDDLAQVVDEMFDAAAHAAPRQPALDLRDIKVRRGDRS